MMLLGYCETSTVIFTGTLYKYYFSVFLNNLTDGPSSGCIKFKHRT